MGDEAHVVKLARTLQELRDYADTLLAIKARSDSSSQLPAACAAGTALLLRAREQERSAALHVARLKEHSAQQHNKLDHDSLQLHNLLYEQQYYDKEIAACRAFTSSYTEQQIGSVVPPQPAHEQELERLAVELQQRQALQQQLQQVQHQKEQLLRERNKVSNSYAELRQQVEQCHTGNKALVEATQPSSTSSMQADAEAAQLLPLPLYIIYIQAAAAANVVGLPLSVTIEGNPAVAKQQQQQQLLSAQPGTDEPQAPAVPQDAKRRRKQLQQEDQTYQVCANSPAGCGRLWAFLRSFLLGCNCSTFSSSPASVSQIRVSTALLWVRPLAMPHQQLAVFVHCVCCLSHGPLACHVLPAACTAAPVVSPAGHVCCTSSGW